MFMEKEIVELCNLMIKRVDKKWDNLMIIDGKERVGKSTFAKKPALYIAKKLGKDITLDNVFFNIEKLNQFILDNNKEVIIWDEAALGGLGSQWQNDIQKRLITTMMTCGSHNHTFFFIVPSFFKLSWYLSVHRSLGLINIFSPDLLSRGSFKCYNTLQKAWIYNNFRRSETYGNTCSFRGQWNEKGVENLWDDTKYEEKKRRAIEEYNLIRKRQKEETISKLWELKYKIATKFPVKYAAELLGTTIESIYKWRKLHFKEKPIENDVFGGLSNGNDLDKGITNLNLPKTEKEQDKPKNTVKKRFIM